MNEKPSLKKSKEKDFIAVVPDGNGSSACCAAVNLRTCIFSILFLKEKKIVQRKSEKSPLSTSTMKSASAKRGRSGAKSEAAGTNNAITSAQPSSPYFTARQRALKTLPLLFFALLVLRIGLSDDEIDASKQFQGYHRALAAAVTNMTATVAAFASASTARRAKNRTKTNSNKNNSNNIASSDDAAAVVPLADEAGVAFPCAAVRLCAFHTDDDDCDYVPTR